MKQKYRIIAILAAVLIFCALLSFHSYNPVVFVHQIHHKQTLSTLKEGDKFNPLPSSVIDGVKYFVYFVGRSHSGHSIVGSILDSHPHMIVAHEAKIFVQLKDNPEHFTTKAAIFNELWKNSYNSSHYDGGLRNNNSRDIKSKGYTLQVKALHQGTYVSHVDVIGDKNGGHTVALFNQNPAEWERVLSKLKSLIDIPLKVIYVIRNPFDNIASARLYNTKSIQMKDVRSSNETFHIGGDKTLAHQIKRHFAAHQAIMDAKKKYNMDMLEVHVKDLVEHPNATITKMCDFLGISCSNTYIQGCSDTLFKTESKIRYKVKWTMELISEVKNYILEYDNLIRYYSFDS